MCCGRRLLGAMEEKIIQGEDAPDLRVYVGWVLCVDVDLTEKDSRGGMERKERLCLLVVLHGISPASTP